MNFFGIHFTRLNISMERWLQALAFAALILTYFFGHLIMFFFTIYLLVFTSYWWMTLLYILWICTLDSETCETGGRRSEWVQNWIWWKYLRDYFPVNLKRVMELDPKKNYLLCGFPHGVVSMAPILTGCTNHGGFHDLFPNLTPYCMTLGSMFQIPFFREFLFSLGMCSVSAKSIEYVLSNESGGNLCNILVGGGREIFYCRPGRFTIYYNKRKGFVRCALKTGSPLVPVFIFGETDHYDRIDISEDSIILRFIKNTFAKRYRDVPFFIPVGRGAFGLLPSRGPVTVVVGKPLEVPKIENPTTEQVDEVHEKFKQCIIDLFEEQKHFYVKDALNTKLEII